MNTGPLSLNETRAILARLTHQPKKWLGQNFLIDGNIVRKSLELGEVEVGDTVIEIGPGLGTLTRTLLCAGANVYAVETDRRMIYHLNETLIHQFPYSFNLIEGDAVTFPYANLTLAKEGEFKIISNLPYSITSPWMEAICNGPHPALMVLMLQREAAERLTAQIGTPYWSALTAQVHLAFDKIKLHPVSSKAFSPQPKVESCLLVLRRRLNAKRLSLRARTVSRMLFTMRRKQIGASVKKLFPADKDVSAWLDHLTVYGLSHCSRPDNIPAEAWLEL